MLKIARATSTMVVVVALVALAASALGPRLGWYRIQTVLSGSMRPAFSPGDVVVVTPEPTRNLRVGQVITYNIPIGDHHVESHRVIRILTHGAQPVIQTKGDANPSPDPWRAKLTAPTVWHLALVIPKLGWLIMWLRQPVIQHLTVIVIPMLLAAMWLVRIWRPNRSVTADPKTP